MVCGVLCSRFVCLDPQMRVHKVLIVDYCIGGKLSLSLPEKNLFVVQGGRRLTEISRSRNRLWRFRGRLKPADCSVGVGHAVALAVYPQT